MRTVLVIGGTGTIGSAVVQELGKRHRVITAGRSSGDHRVAIEDAASVRRLFADVGEVDHVVVACGALHVGPLGDMTQEQFRIGLESKLMGQVNVALAAQKYLNDGGSITLTSGTAADRPGPGWAAAAGVCGAMDAVTRALAVELAPIRVNAVKAGVTRSPLWGDGAEVEEMYATIGRSLPLGRVGEVDDVAEAYLYLMSQAYATGTIVTIDGGALLA